ncbi:ATP-binding protein [Streptomyces sp. NPDC000410]|uniref:sensor histidine kinase n=1 Tax=Streptomyces sp. NPDC000410 TaxID=3154254 RepID=UPI003322B1D5
MSSERARLTALYGGLLVLAGGLLTGLVYVLVREELYSNISRAVTTAVPASAVQGGWMPAMPAVPGEAVPAERLATTRTVITGAAEEAALSSLLTVSGLVLAAYALVSVLLAWWMAGRVLRPVGVITATARRLSGENLHERIGLKAPPGELKELADTFDAMLGRIEQLVSAQQRFAANAAHELRTPLAVQRAAAEIGLADDPPPEKVARIRDKLIEVADGSERLIEGLLLLSVSEQGLRRRESVELAEVAEAVAAGLAEEATRRAVTVEVEARPLTVRGDAVLLGHLVHNLVANALRYNRPGGRVVVRVRDGDGHGLEVVNTGPPVPPDTVPLLFEPFRRAEARQHTPGEGAGLGLPIVASIARAHGATMTARSNPAGGLTVRVTWPRRP